MLMIDEVHTLRLRHASGWGWIVVYGLLLLAIGVMALLRPFAASFATGFLLGILLVMGGLLKAHNVESELYRVTEFAQKTCASLLRFGCD